MSETNERNGATRVHFRGWGADDPVLRNPHRGYRFEMNFTLPELKSPWPNEQDDTGDVPTRLGIMRDTYGDDPALTQLYFYLGEYIEQDIPDEAFTLMEQTLQGYRDAGMSVVLRFGYDHSFLPQVPYTAAGIVHHIHQLAPMVARNADMITVWQAGFFGRWGEWGYSFFPLSTDPEAVNTVVRALVEALPDHIDSQVRYEAKRSLIDPALQRRFGYHNDYVTLQGDMDLIDPEMPHWEHYLEVAEDHPMDAELPWDPEQDVDDYPWREVIDGLAIARRLQTLRVDTFSIVHNALLTIPEWRTHEVTEQDLRDAGLPIGRDWFRQADGTTAPTRTMYDYLRDHLGFRIEADELTWSTDDTGVDVELTVANRGFSRPRRPMPMRFVLLDAAGTEVASVATDEDWREWLPSGRAEVEGGSEPEQHTVHARLPLPAGGVTGLRLGVAFVDPDGSHGFAPRLANGDIAFENGVNILTTLG